MQRNNWLFCLSENEVGAADLAAKNALSGRLQDDLWLQEASGLRNLAWKPLSDSPLAPKIVDLNWLVAQPLLPFLVNHIPAQLLYQSLAEHGLEDAVEVVEYIRGPQLTKVLDFDIFARDASNHVDDVEPHKFLSWLKVWFDISPEFAADRFLELDEETIILLTTKLLEVVPAGIGRFDEANENIWTTNDDKFHLRLRHEDKDDFELVHALIEALYKKNIKLAQSVLSHSAMLVREESLEDEQRWRSGRLADAGFVQRDEAQELLRPRNFSDLARQIREAIAQERARYSTGDLDAFVDELDEETEADLETFRQLPPVVAARVIEQALGEEEVLLLSGERRLTAEQLLEDDALMAEAARAVAKQCLRLLSFVEVEGTRHSERAELDIELAFARIAQDDAVHATALKQRVARIANSVVAATSYNFEADSTARALTIVRGAINIGLEKCVEHKAAFAQDEFESADKVTELALIVGSVGPEFLFKLGWSLVCGLSLQTAEKLKEVATLQPQKYGFLDRALEVEFSDGQKAQFDLIALLKRGRFMEVRRWLAGIELELSPGSYNVLTAVLNRIPLYPEMFGAVQNHSAQAGRRPFEKLVELVDVSRFIENLEHNLG